MCIYLDASLNWHWSAGVLRYRRIWQLLHREGFMLITNARTGFIIFLV
jgi:hypothetical protein